MYEFNNDIYQVSSEQMYAIDTILNRKDIEEIIPLMLKLYSKTTKRVKQLNSLIPEITENALEIAQESENEYWHALETVNCIFKPIKIKKTWITHTGQHMLLFYQNAVPMELL